MTRELKQSKNFHEALRRLGVKNPGEVGLGLPIQLTATVDDLSSLTQPEPVCVAGGGDYQGAVALQSGICCEINVLSPGGAWLLLASSLQGADCGLYLTQQTVIDVGAGPVPLAIVFNTGIFPGFPPLQSTFSEGYSTIATGNQPAFFINGGQIIGLGIWLPMGAFVSMAAVVNTANNYSLMIQEVP